MYSVCAPIVKETDRWDIHHRHQWWECEKWCCLGWCLESQRTDFRILIFQGWQRAGTTQECLKRLITLHAWIFNCKDWG